MPKSSHSPKRTNKSKRGKSIEAATEPAQFLTIDLDVRSRRSLAPLLSVWPEAYQPIEGSRWLIRTAFVDENAEKAAKHLLGHIAKLKGKALVSWKQAHRRIFDIGVRAGGPGRAFEEVQLSSDMLRRISAVHGQIKVTIYPAEPKTRLTQRRRAR
jgi:hypothetical protein